MVVLYDCSLRSICVTGNLTGSALEIADHKSNALHPPTLLRFVFLILLTIQVWIAVGYFVGKITSISVLMLLAFLWVPLGILILTVFLSDGTWGTNSPASDEDCFNLMGRSFFIVLMLIPFVSIVHELVLGTLGIDEDLYFPTLIMVCVFFGLFLRKVVALISTYLFTFYNTVSVL